MRADKRFLGAITCVALVAGLLAWQDDRGGAVSARDVSPPAVLQPPAVSALASIKVPLPAASPDNGSLTQQVERLMATHDPDKAYLAYSLLAACDEFKKTHDRLVFDESAVRTTSKPGFTPGLRGLTDSEKQGETALCSTMTERQRLSRLDYLAIAAKAGVPIAAVSFAREGPFGDPSALKTRPDDPLVKEWKALAVAQLTTAAEAGANMVAFNYLIGQYGSGSDLTEKNLPLAYRYELAMGLVYRDLSGRDTGLAKLFAEDSDMMVAAAKEIGPEERAAQAAAAKRIADFAKEQRKRTHDRAANPR